ncbi:hypothetical protein RM545_04395 [Zunongwangia sp. F260]|uniref:Capsule polysaccharide biosynthesis protein n=1 Tax=Autumnicola lenta TaxID=3075593 RepID=A0ABU3CHU9_9FLAO|nr:hypothetical protein [Zunongwangia sp. F260]MDT0645919.1 hypothetical protein [Zunongwangia sp. F260]
MEGEYKAVPIELYERIYNHLPKFIDMYSRVNLHNSINYNEFNFHQFLDHFNLMINYYYTLFTDNNIDILIQNNSPHAGYDYIPHVLAKEMDIRTLYIGQTSFPNRFFHYWEFHDFGTFKTTKNLFDLPPPIKIENKFEKDLPYMKKNRRDGFKFSNIKSPRSLHNELTKYVPEYQLAKDLVKSNYRGQAYYRYKLRKTYEKNRRNLINEVDLNEPFVYFALHLQPEKTTSSYGGKYSDQALALEHLSSILPKGWKIYVKENPKQTYFMRNPEFFRRLERIPNLVFVSPAYNTYDLIRHTKICATISGTVGWEAITGGKTVLIFGWGVWYKTLPGVYSFSPDLDLEKISSEKVDFTELQSKFNELTAKLAPGIVLNENYPSYYKDYNVEENNIQVAKSLEKIIRSKFN